ncbi:class I SAM-dependent methyltransferase [Paenibacillus sp. Root444D2]|uniref:class I SAM-dependent methyltransferase n=2 Tax=unclassified Paenibacillus TaxID=185978 RepID=UPI003FA78D01
MVLEFQSALPIKQYDVITCFETVEHIQKDGLFISRLFALLKPAGVLFISAPTKTFIRI